METQRTPLSSTDKNKQNMVEIWDSHETVNKTVQEILKTMLPKYDGALEKIITEDESKKDSPLPAYLSCPNDNVSEEENESSSSEQEEHFDPNERTIQSNDAFSFDSIARHNQDT
ncbi:hypothetical protein LXL04_008022 [Taraxacum kok-saghyz]